MCSRSQDGDPEVCQSSLGKGLDWVRDTTLEDLGNRLIRGWTYQKSEKASEVDWLF